MGNSSRRIALCAVMALGACGGGGSSSPTAVVPSSGLVLNWVSRSGSSGGAGTQADPIHLAAPPLSVTVTASRGGVAQQFNLSADISCTAVSLTTDSQAVTIGAGPAPGSSAVVFGTAPNTGPWGLSWSIASFGKGVCSVTATALDGARATLQVYSEL